MAGNTLTIRTDPELVARLTTLAAAMNRSRNWVMEDALRVYLENHAWQIEGIQAAMTGLEQGEGIPHEAVMAEMDDLIAAQDSQVSAPA